MANLIPAEAKKTMVREYWMRAISVWVFLAAAAIAAVGSLMVPTYVLVDTQHRAAGSRAQDAEATQNEFADANSALRAANALSGHLAADTEGVILTELIETVDRLAGNRITITSFVFARGEDEAAEPFRISGAAADRTALLDFRDALRADPQFANVNLPLADLAGDEDISFSIELTLTE